MHPIYISGNSPLHALHPLTKLAAALLILVVAEVLPWPLVPLVLCGLLFPLALIAGVLKPLLRAALVILLPIALSLFVIQGLLFPPTKTLPLSLGPITIWLDGLVFASLITVRLLVLTATVLLVLQTTHPADLILALTERGLPLGIGYVLLVSLQLVPDMSARATAILEAQRSRGLETKGLLRRLRTLPALIGPLIVGALLDVEERAMALESRAFASVGPKTSLRTLHDSLVQRAARPLLLTLTVAVLIARFTILRGGV